MVDFEKFLADINQLNILFQYFSCLIKIIFCYRDKRYQRKIGFSIELEIATTGMSVLKLLKGSKWKNVKVIATIM